MKDNLWARVRGLGSITWKGCHWVELLVVRTRRAGSSSLCYSPILNCYCIAI